MKKFIIIITVLVIVVLAGFFLSQMFEQNYSSTGEEVNTDTEQPEEVAVTEPVDNTKTVIGQSVKGRDIIVSHFGEGDKEILFVGGIHGGYEWNTVLLAYKLMDYLEANPAEVPAGVKVSVIPVLNPDGLNKTVGSSDRFDLADVPDDKDQLIAGRFNDNGVDLNRNFDCDWQAEGTWQSRKVDGGSKAFSEPETQALKGYIESQKPQAVVMFYSAAGGVFASNCHSGVLPETTTLTNLYAKASGYKAYEDFDFYEVTGDAVNWMAKNEIPAISILLSNHESIEWDKNLNGIKAVLGHYAE